MATILSSTTVSPTLNITRSRKFSTLSSSSSVFFSYKASRLSGFRLGRHNNDGVSSQRRGMSCTCLFGLGVPELVVIAGVAALLFGPKQLPEVGRSMGKTIKSFQQAAKEFESELKKDSEASATSVETSTTQKISTNNEGGVEEDAKKESLSMK